MKKVFLTLLFLLIGALAYSAEQRCNELAANCVCSEPLNTNVLDPAGKSFYNPGDSAEKECSSEGVPGGAISRNIKNLSATSESNILGVLPRGHRVNYVLRGPEGHANIWFVGQGAMPSGKKRYGFRWYIYHSPNFQFVGEGPSENTKFAQFSDMNLLLNHTHGGAINMYNFVDWKPRQDCCPSGPGPGANVGRQGWKGRWWRAEVVISNPEGKGATYPGTGPVIRLYLKNVTENAPEMLVIDTGMFSRLSPSTAFRDPPIALRGVMANLYRQGRGAGFRAVSHYMAASWDTDTGQRIGAAYEVEGGGPAPISTGAITATPTP